MHLVVGLENLIIALLEELQREELQVILLIQEEQLLRSLEQRVQEQGHQHVRQQGHQHVQQQDQVRILVRHVQLLDQLQSLEQRQGLDLKLIGQDLQEVEEDMIHIQDLTSTDRQVLLEGVHTQEVRHLLDLEVVVLLQGVEGLKIKLHNGLCY